jgi:hypothetical protein
MGKTTTAAAGCVMLSLLAACAGKTDSTDTAAGGSGTGSGSATGGGASSSSSSSGGGDTTSTPTTTPPPSWSGYCERSAKRATSCNEVDKQTECLRDGVCFANSMRTDAIDPYGECLASRPCSQPIEECVAATSAKYATDADVTRFRTVCQKQRDACKGSAPGNDLCNSATLVKTTVLRDIEGCLSKPCEEIEKCVDLKVAPLGCR